MKSVRGERNYQEHTRLIQKLIEANLDDITAWWLSLINKTIIKRNTHFSLSKPVHHFNNQRVFHFSVITKDADLCAGSWSSCYVFIGSWWFLELLFVFLGCCWFLELLFVFFGSWWLLELLFVFFFLDAGELLLVFLDAGGSWSSCCVFIGSWWFLELLLVFFGSWWFLELLFVFGTVQSAGENANSCGWPVEGAGEITVWELHQC